jgi:hypothetical protein
MLKHALKGGFISYHGDLEIVLDAERWRHVDSFAFGQHEIMVVTI